jgi:predicted regulator of Ras-like GTPase activity (Roadblock/LC7/MglB family)
LTPEVQRAFMASVTDLQANVNWPALLSALAQMNTEGAIAALNISPAAWTEYSSAMTAAYAKAGASTAAQIKQMGAANIGVRFNMSNPRAEQWIRENVADLVVNFTQEQIATARSVIEAGYAQGQGPRNIAVDLAGRATGGTARTGGVLGLDKPRADRLQAVTLGMRSAEGVRGLVVVHQDGNVSIRYKVNKATAQRIIRAYHAGTEVPQAERVISERQYSNALLKDRADTIAETETASAVMSARDEEWRQLTESQGLTESAIIKTWRHNRGSRDGRLEHIAMNGKSVRGLKTAFVLPDGTRMQYPHDPAGSARHNIRCACSADYRLDHSAGLT